jgi:hypothetical protein
MIPPQHDLPTHKCLYHSLVSGHAREYSQAVWTLAPFFPAPTSSNTTLALTTLNPDSNGFFWLFLKDYELYQDFKLSSNSFKLAFQCMPHLFANGHFGMVFLTPSKLFSLKRFCEWIFTNVSTLFSCCIRSHFTSNYTCPWNNLLFNHDHALRWSLSHYHGGNVISIHKSGFMPSTLWCLCNTFSLHQFGMTTKGGFQSKAITHGIKCTLDLHPN